MPEPRSSTTVGELASTDVCTSGCPVSWHSLLNPLRRRPSTGKSYARTEGRTEFERDYDRILFSTPVRRMADKTQLFPQEMHDAIHTRLTHSHEDCVVHLLWEQL